MSSGPTLAPPSGGARSEEGDAQRSSGAGSGLDPRLRARRIAVRRDEGRRRLRRLVALGVIAGGVASVVGAVLSPLFDVDQVSVVGAERAGVDEVLVASGVERGAALAFVSSERVAMQVEALPWVDSASVRRRWPGSVVVVVTERTPLVAYADGRGRWALVDGVGRVLERVAEVEPGVPVVGATVVRSDPGDVMGAEAGPVLAVLQALPSRVRARVLTLEERGSDIVAEVRLDGGALAELTFAVLGDVDAVASALTTLLDSVDHGRIGAIDLRVPEAPVLTGP